MGDALLDLGDLLIRLEVCQRLARLAGHGELSRTLVVLADLLEPDEALPVAWEAEAEPETPLMAGLGGGACSG